MGRAAAERQSSRKEDAELNEGSALFHVKHYHETPCLS